MFDEWVMIVVETNHKENGKKVVDEKKWVEKVKSWRGLKLMFPILKLLIKFVSFEPQHSVRVTEN